MESLEIMRTADYADATDRAAPAAAARFRQLAENAARTSSNGGRGLVNPGHTYDDGLMD